jgi:hypothetical protein
VQTVTEVSQGAALSVDVRNRLDGFEREPVRLGVIADGRPASHASVASRERLARVTKHHLSSSPFFEAAVRSRLHIG